MTGNLRIYILQSKLQKKNISASEGLFPGLSIIIQNKKFKTQLYDTRDAFPFFFVLMPHLQRNIPSNIHYESMNYGILRFAKTTLDINTLVVPWVLTQQLLRKICFYVIMKINGY